MNIKDIAKIAGVSVSTVSRVLNNSEEVSEKTKENIIEIMKENNYVPNNSARNLKRITSNAIGVLVDSGYNPFFYEFINIINSRVSEVGFSMIIQFMDGRRNDMFTAKEFIKEKRLSGLICMGLDFKNVDKNLFIGIEVPIVAISSSIPEDILECLSSININDFDSAYKAVKVLIDAGHREIGIIGSNDENDLCGIARFSAYKRAQKDSGIRVKKRFMEFADYTFSTGYDAMKRLLLKKEVPTAVFVISDIMAVGAARACKELGYVVPDDISIIGFDGIDYGKYYVPAITTVRQPFEYMARESVSLIMELIKEGTKNRHINFETEILKRESVKILNK